MTKVICMRIAGLCNRLRGIVSLWRSGESFSIYENVTRLCPGKLSDILDNDFKVHNEPVGYPLPWRLFVEPHEVPADFAKLRPLKNGWPAIDLEYERIPQNVRDLFIPYFKKFKFKQCVLDRVNEINIEELDPIGVHCREADDWLIAGRSIPLNKYFKAIDSLPDINKLIFLSAHTQKVVDAFVQKYGSRIVQLKDRSYPQRTTKDFQDVAAELLILSKCKTIVGDELSSFTETAWWFGECKPTVIRVSRDLNLPKR